MAAVFALLLTLRRQRFRRISTRSPIPADAAYIPRPEWYFLSLFELLKYFPGPFEPVATMVIPGAVVGFLLALPFLDRGPERRPFSRGRACRARSAMLAIVGGRRGADRSSALPDTPTEVRPERLGAARDCRPSAGDRRRTTSARAVT